MSLIEETLKERKKTHGDFKEHSLISQQLKAIYYNSKNYQYLTDMQKEAIEMILHKIARILVGNPNEKDHFVDIEGYSNLVSRELAETLPLDLTSVKSVESDLVSVEPKDGFYVAVHKNYPAIQGTGLTIQDALFNLGVELATK